MNERAVFTVFTLDPQTSTYSSVGHNLSSQEAGQKVNELQGQGKKAQFLEQPSRHRAMTFKRCKPCATAAQNLSQGIPGQVRQESENPEAGSEGD